MDIGLYYAIICLIMALTKCPECGKEVSTSAETCPHCGYPLKVNQADKALVEETEHLSKVYLKNQKHHMIAELVCSVICIIAGIVIAIVLGGVVYGPDALFIVLGIILSIVGIGGVIYYRHRLKNF